MENVDDLHFAGRVNPMDVDHAPMHHEESSAAIPSRKRYSCFSRFLIAENELILWISAAGSPEKMCEHFNEFAITR
jgi:hypothetical protein